MYVCVTTNARENNLEHVLSTLAHSQLLVQSALNLESKC